MSKPSPTGTPWTDAEIARTIARRTRPDGQIVAFEICGECRCGFERGSGKLGYSQDKPLCFDCYGLRRAADRRSVQDDVLALLSNSGLSTRAISDELKIKWGEAERVLRDLCGHGRARRVGKHWFCVQAHST